MGSRLRVRGVLFVVAGASLVFAFATAAVAASPGRLDLCKELAGGIASGTVFSFQAVQSGIVRTIAVEAGDCAELVLPFESKAQSKGSFRSRPADVAGVVPPGSTLLVDGASLSASQLQGVLSGSRNVSAQSNLLLNLAQQLIAAELNILRGVQPPAVVSAAIADANAGISVTVSGSGNITIATSLTQAQLNTLVKTLSSFNEGKLKGPATPSSTTIQITEVIPADTAVSSIVCVPAGACAGADLATGSVAATVSTGATTAVTYTDGSTTLGTLELCKAAGTHIETGQVFTFETPDGERAVAADGDCAELLLADVNPSDSDGHYRIFEEGCGSLCLGGDDGWAVSAIDCVPTGRCTDTSLAVGAATVDVAVGQTTTVTFTNRATWGTLRVCKAAGTGIASGALFPFQGPAGTFTLAADGSCAEMVLPEVNTGDSDGHYRIHERGCGELCSGGDEGYAISSIACVPAERCIDRSPAVGEVVVDVVGGETTTVTFTNRSTLGTLRICKAAGSGVAVGTVFTFETPDGQRTAVAGGACAEMVLPEVNPGDSTTHYSVFEHGCGENCFGGAQGWVVTSIACDPVDRCVDTSLGVGHARVDVVGASTTTVTFTNSVP